MAFKPTQVISFQQELRSNVVVIEDTRGRGRFVGVSLPFVFLEYDDYVGFRIVRHRNDFP